MTSHRPAPAWAWLLLAWPFAAHASGNYEVLAWMTGALLAQMILLVVLWIACRSHRALATVFYLVAMVGSWWCMLLAAADALAKPVCAVSAIAPFVAAFGVARLLRRTDAMSR